MICVINSVISPPIGGVASQDVARSSIGKISSRGIKPDSSEQEYRGQAEVEAAMAGINRGVPHPLGYPGPSPLPYGGSMMTQPPPPPPQQQYPDSTEQPDDAPRYLPPSNDHGKSPVSAPLVLAPAADLRPDVRISMPPPPGRLLRPGVMDMLQCVMAAMAAMVSWQRSFSAGATAGMMPESCMRMLGVPATLGSVRLPRLGSGTPDRPGRLHSADGGHAAPKMDAAVLACPCAPVLRWDGSGAYEAHMADVFGCSGMTNAMPALLCHTPLDLLLLSAPSGTTTTLSQSRRLDEWGTVDCWAACVLRPRMLGILYQVVGRGGFFDDDEHVAVAGLRWVEKAAAMWDDAVETRAARVLGMVYEYE
ncbi:hypothetical protein GMORB2_2530 [Geosmithia morbida]|uniref:Uncharacterized protein n=1 Tax=Geosmithia morbida TaxID=1094350 RepID=A0A9P4YSM2_9HYPO|nr:uncharacterized protein GMORB2_2530 [Geosmithia morbida]KAF4121044.1 hypothetical protein GMORB2_2530 [Geosmithia morbida]